ncbi:unnamed protein product [Albugo candida]|uniref:Amidophosphoribosyltransferase n=3 Tax=Albugo candida TaxID=65357 RepID=A0A024GSR9_9STRA|nr:unnamed protein product [Albugo candida]|eukprot:CCI49619.1 unnamed protein product [Albugo candida]
MCGIIALILANPQHHANQLLYDALTVMQHRGQDAAGIMTLQSGRFFLRKDNGLVRDVFRQNHMINLRGPMGIGHCRYPTAGTSNICEAQPFYTNSPYGIALAHNGNLTNSRDLLDQLSNTDFRHVNTGSDSELLLNILADELMKHVKEPLTNELVFKAVERLMNRCSGGYTAVVVINKFGILAFRDPNGIRPLVFGKRASDSGIDYAVASESAAIDALGFDLLRDVAPGEAILIPQGKPLAHNVCSTRAQLNPCIFEYVYFARPDSCIDKVSVYQARLNMGLKLADKLLRHRPTHDIDVVIPIPDTSRTSALELSRRLNIPYREGFVKNRYITRTFIMPGQKARKKTVRLKLNAISAEFRDKNVLLVDDSIVRGTTSRQIVQIARENGARSVLFASAAPAIRHPSIYGIDMPTRDELIAYNRTDEEIAEKIGADWVIYQDLEDLEACVRQENPAIRAFDSSCFTGTYVTEDVDEKYFARLHAERCDAQMQLKNSEYASSSSTIIGSMSDEVIDMYNVPQF